jgi:hypothetical protein
LTNPHLCAIIQTEIKEIKEIIIMMTTYYITRNKQGKIEEVFLDGIVAAAYAKACGFTLEKITAHTAGMR